MKHGLIDGYKFSGKQGVLDFVRQAGCIQFDTIDICGKMLNWYSLYTPIQNAQNRMEYK